MELRPHQLSNLTGTVQFPSELCLECQSEGNQLLCLRGRGAGLTGVRGGGGVCKWGDDSGGYQGCLHAVSSTPVSSLAQAHAGPVGPGTAPCVCLVPCLSSAALQLSRCVGCRGHWTGPAQLRRALCGTELCVHSGEELSLPESHTGSLPWPPAWGLFGLKMLYFFQTQAVLKVSVNEFVQCQTVVTPAGKSYRGITSFKQHVYLAFLI